MKASYCVAIERAVDVVGAAAAGARLVVARLEPGDLEVDRVAMDDRRDGVEEGERVLAGRAADRRGERRRGERPGRDDHRAAPASGSAGDLARGARSIRGSASIAACTAAAKPSRSTASAPPAGSLWASPRGHDQRAAAPHLLVQQADRVVERVVGAERVGAHQLGQRAGLMRLGRARRAASRAAPRAPPMRALPGRLAAGEPAADHLDRLTSYHLYSCTLYCTSQNNITLEPHIKPQPNNEPHITTSRLLARPTDSDSCADRYRRASTRRRHAICRSAPRATGTVVSGASRGARPGTGGGAVRTAR